MVDSTLRMLIDATARLGSSSAEDRLSGVQAVVEAVNRIKALSPTEQVEALTQAHGNVDELKQRVERATAEYEDARIWLKVLEGVVRPDAPATPGEGAERVAATVLAELQNLKPPAP